MRSANWFWPDFSITSLTIHITFGRENYIWQKALTQKTRCKKLLQIHMCNLFANATNKEGSFCLSCVEKAFKGVH